jgi:hypothetical protein
LTNDPRKASLTTPVAVGDDEVDSVEPAEIGVVMVGDDPVVEGEPPPGPDHVGMVLMVEGQKALLIRLRTPQQVAGLARQLITAGRTVWAGKAKGTN